MLRALAQRAPRPMLARRRLRLLVGSSSRPHREKKDGEDAYFASAADNALGVADGVGGSKRAGVDPGDFSRRLLAHAQRHAGGGAVAAVAAARAAATRDDLCARGGSSTLLVATLDGDRLEVCNFGDSACALLRPAPRRSRGAVGLWPRVVLRTADQTHYFNCPYQASAADDLGDEAALGACGADALAATARAGDVLVAATDGFWDNVRDDAAQRAVAARVGVVWASAARQGGFGSLSDRVAGLSDDAAAADDCRENLDALAAALADAAVAVFDDESAATPFTDAARLDGLEHYGGKEDDVAVVVGLVVADGARLSALDEALVHNFRDAALPEDGAADEP